jgi:crotonobetainyl-CoA:carnitine CoA-transferase CaiB-like acyl-CoA transferase
MILGDLGAEVIKITPPPSASARQIARELNKRAIVFEAVNRNKQSILLNLKSKKGRDIFYRLVKKADVVVEGFRPGVAKRLGVDYPALEKLNPQIICCSITGYGQDGPYRDLPGHDINYISIAGALDPIGSTSGLPAIPLNLLADYGGGGKDAAIGIVSALLARSKTNKGQHIDISLTDSVISLLTESVLDYYFESGVGIRRGGHPLNGGFPYYNVYETRDKKYITIGCIEPWFWANLCRAIGKEEFIPFHFKLEHYLHPPEERAWQEILSFLRVLFLSKTRDEWFNFLVQRDVPVGKVYTLDEVFADPQVLHRRMMVEVEHSTEGKVKQVGIAIKLSDTPGAVRSSPPLPGQHTEAILATLGYSTGEINELRKEGIVD